MQSLVISLQCVTIGALVTRVIKCRYRMTSAIRVVKVRSENKKESQMKKIIGLIVITVMGMVSVAQADGTYYVVRHAEKQATDLTGGDNPMLTEKGVKRAAHIVSILKNEKIDAVFSTETLRTVQTATPTAADRGLEVQPFSTNDLEGFANMLKSMDGKFLIVAHSSSTPDLASLLSGTKQPKLAETDYEQMFKVVIKDGKATITQFQTTF